MQRLERKIGWCPEAAWSNDKEQLALKIAREIYKGKGKLESFHALECIRSYFFDLSMDDLKVIAGQYGINI